MNIEQVVIDKIFDELKKAEKKFPGFPEDVVHCSAILAEESGEVVKAALDYYYGREASDEKLIKEIAQVGAMSFRFLLRMLDYKHYPKQEKK